MDPADASHGEPASAAPAAAGETAKRPARKRARRIVTWAVRGAFVVVLAGAFVLGCDRLFYYPSRTIHYSPEMFHRPYEDVWFTASDGVKLHGWFLPAERPVLRRSGPSDEAAGEWRPKGTVVHFHGNAENITAHIPLVEWLPRRGFNVLMFDYRGYGKSDGSISRGGTILDGLAAVDYALSRPDVDAQRLFAYGQSLGGAVAVVVAAQRPQVRAVVAESTFGDYRRIAARHLQKMLWFEAPCRLLASALVSDGHDPIDAVASLSPRPLLVISGERDSICQPELGRELFDAAAAPKAYWLAPEAEHLGVLDVESGELQRRVLEWFDGAK